MSYRQIVNGFQCIRLNGHDGECHPGDGEFSPRLNLSTARQRLALLDLDAPPKPRVVQHVVFPIPLQRVTLGISREFEVSVAPNFCIRPRRLCVNVHTANMFFLDSVYANNVIVIGTPVDAYHFAPQNLQLPVYVRQTNPVRHTCTHCGAPRTDDAAACVHCGTLWPTRDVSVIVVPLPSSEDGGRAIHCPVIHPSGRILLKGHYNGFVPREIGRPGMEYDLSIVFFGDGLAS